MALGDYILCAMCDMKLIYDGSRAHRDGWEEKFGSEPKIYCPDCMEKLLYNQEIKLRGLKEKKLSGKV